MKRPFLVFLVLPVMAAAPARASDHLDTPTVTADPSADLGEL
jgi:hypothetical protein